MSKLLTLAIAALALTTACGARPTTQDDRCKEARKENLYRSVEDRIKAEAPTPPAPATETHPPVTTEKKPFWGSMVWVEYDSKQVWSMDDMTEGSMRLEKDVELKETGEKINGFTIFAPPDGFTSVFITQIAVNFSTQQVKYTLPTGGLKLELSAARMEADMSGYHFVPNIYKVDIDHRPLSCRGTPTTPEGEKVVEEFAQHGLACTP